MLKGFTRNFKPLKILTEEQVETIHKGTLDVLWGTGIRFENEKSLKFFEKNDCKVDYKNNRVHFPPNLVEECLHKCPSSLHVKARDPKNDLVLGGNTVYFINFPGMKILDPDTWESRVPTRKENYDGVTILDALDSLHYLDTYTPYFGFEGVPPCMGIPESVAAKLRNSAKCLATGTQNDSEIFTIEMAKAVGAEIMVCCYSSPPLTYYTTAIKALFRAVKTGFPILLESCPTMGSTGPATIAGSTVTSNAELIGGIVLAQLIKPGTRVTAIVSALPQNMRQGSPIFGAIETALQTAAGIQVWQKYEVPTVMGLSGPTNSKKIDFQGSYEKATLALIGALCGCNLVELHGGVHAELAWSPLQAILDDDIAGMVGRFIEGVKVNDETLAIDLIEEVGPIPGHYLSKAHTRKWWKREQFIPKAADRLTYSDWLKTGKKDCLDYARERMGEILTVHKPKRLTKDQENAIENILKEGREYYRKKGLISDTEWTAYKKDLESPNYPYA